MFAYAIRRILISIPVMLVATFVVFGLVTAMGDPTDRLYERNPPPAPEVIAGERARLNVDVPFLQRYWDWLVNVVVHQDFGPSVRSDRIIGDEIGERFFVTMRLIAAAMVLAVILAIIAGVVSAVRQYTISDYTLTFAGFLFLSIPAFWFAAFLKEAGIWFNQNVMDRPFFATIGDATPNMGEATSWERFSDIAGHMVLPTISLALISFASWSRFQRASMLEVLNSDYIRLARAKGLRWRKVLRKHALRTALIPLATVTALDIGSIFGGAVITETVFQWNGMGVFLLESITMRDVYAIEGWLLIAAAVVIAFNLFADLLYAVLDPRIRYD